MNANCIICSDLFQPKSEIYVTSCGHLFHFVCIIQWIERSRTCPQCRHKETVKTIHRIYCNVPSTDNVKDDVVTLQAKLDNCNFQLSLKEKDIENFSRKYKKCNNNSHALSDITLALQQNAKANKHAMKLMKEQLLYYKEKLKDNGKYVCEVNRLQSQIGNMRHLRSVMDDCEEQVEDIVRGNRDARAMCLFVAALQKVLTEVDRKAQKLASQLRLTKSDFNESKAAAYVQRKKHEELEKSLVLHRSCSAKIASLKELLGVTMTQNQQTDLDDSANRAILESPAPLRPNFNEAFVGVGTQDSPTVAERVSQIKASDSPYLQTKSALGSGYGFLLQAKYKIPTKGATATAASSTDIDKYSIFNKKFENRPNKGEYNYDGFGGHSKEEAFPQPRISGTKRPIARSATQPNMKLKKLNLNATALFNQTKINVFNVINFTY